MTAPLRLVGLDQAEAQNIALVGAKAARLAAARAQGLPALPGLVVPVPAAAPTINIGAAALGRRNNSGAARSAVYNHPQPSLVSGLAEAVGRLGESLVVRSSSPWEDSGVWAGAFTSYRGLRPEEVSTAVVGCWAAIFNPATLERLDAVEKTPDEVPMAVLIQPEAIAACGGVATLGDNDQVTIAATRGHPAGIGAGWAKGQVIVVSGAGSVSPPDLSSPAPQTCREVANLTRDTWNQIGCDYIEWLVTEEGVVVLLQAQPRPRPSDTAATPLSNTPPPDPRLVDVVRMMVRWPGPGGERLVWPWAIGSDYGSPPPSTSTAGPLADVATQVKRGADRLVARRWGDATGWELADRVGTFLEDGAYREVFDLLSRFPPVGPEDAGDHLGNLERLGQQLAGAGVIPHSGWLWYLDPDRLSSPPPTPTRIGTNRWEAWICGVVRSLGSSVTGYPAAPGWGAGRVRFINSAHHAQRFSPREVIFAPLPIGNIAPLLWNAAGLITAGGNPGAHLFEVAQGCGVPAVCGVDLPALANDAERTSELIVALDGDRGEVVTL